MVEDAREVDFGFGFENREGGERSLMKRERE